MMGRKKYLSYLALKLHIDQLRMDLTMEQNIRVCFVLSFGGR